MKKLYNNIILPDIWPPKVKETSLDKPLPVPYLENKPDMINISVGRQLFVDDFLIQKTDLEREEGIPEVLDFPLLEPETKLEMNNGFCTCACPFNGGVFYNSQQRKFQMWYHAGWFDGTAYAESENGLDWKRRTEIDSLAETDRILPHIPGYLRDGDAVWLDHYAADSNERYKMLVFYRCFDTDFRYYHLKPKHAHDDPNSVPPKEITVLYTSPDGISWKERGETTHSGDNTTFFYNPFTHKWIYSMRTFSELDSRIRVRGYYETDDFVAGKNWKSNDVSFWSRTDIFDKPDPELGYYTQLYNLDAVGYESVMLGVYSVFMGPPNFIAEKTGMPKINDLKLGFSRDGFHFSRGSYGNFLSSSREKGRWDYGYLHPANGICTVVGDELYFYYSAFSGKSPVFGYHKYSGGAVGMAKLRRDGFAAMCDNGNGGYLLTEKIEYKGEYFFVNTDCTNGELRVELLDVCGNVLPGYCMEDCISVQTNATKVRVMWKEHAVLENIPNIIQIRFYLKKGNFILFGLLIVILEKVMVILQQVLLREMSWPSMNR
ncbi:MAG: hypothetical protein ACLTBL_08750 [Clostridium sp.]